MNLDFLQLPSPVEQLTHSLVKAKNIQLYVKRDDLIHPEISGNKWRKLKLNIERYYQDRYDGILTFGGAFSNHIAATAAVGHLMNIPTIGIIRGNELTPQSNATLKKAHEQGMKLVFIERSEYHLRNEKEYWHELRREYGNYLIIPEGGANFYGAMGCTEILQEPAPVKNWDYIVVASGTGTTAAGLLMGIPEPTQLISVPVFKKGDFIRDEIKQLFFYSGFDDTTWEEYEKQLFLATDYHFGGYGKYNNDLLSFMNAFYQETQLATDVIYTAKTFYATLDMIQNGSIKENSSVLIIHTGGLQGNESAKESLIF